MYLKSAAQSIGRWLLLLAVAGLVVWAGYSYLSASRVAQQARTEAGAVSEAVREGVRRDAQTRKALTHIEQPAVAAEARLRMHTEKGGENAGENTPENAAGTDEAGRGGPFGLRPSAEYLRVLNEAVEAGIAAQRTAAGDLP